MNTFVLELWFDETKRCNFYTVRWDDAEISETDHFFEKYEKHENLYSDEAYVLLRLITVTIGDVHGAIDDFFDRTENNALALPPKPKNWIPEIMEIGTHFPLRLYCIRISESIVVLFNGGIKNKRTAQESDDIRMRFYEAQAFAQRIYHALQDGTIIIDNDLRTLRDYQGNTEIILY